MQLQSNKETLSDTEYFKKKIMQKEALFNKKVNAIKADIRMLERYEQTITDCTDNRQLEKLNYYKQEVIEYIKEGMNNL